MAREEGATSHSRRAHSQMTPSNAGAMCIATKHTPCESGPIAYRNTEK